MDILTQVGNRTKLTRKRRQQFLAVIRETSNVTKAAQSIGMARQSVYDAKARDPEFAALWDSAIEEATDTLEAEARRRALDGVDRPVYFQGKRVGITKEYSDPLLMFMLRGHRPHKYRERVAETPKQIDKPAINVIVLARQICLGLRLAQEQITDGAGGPGLLEHDNAADD